MDIKEMSYRMQDLYMSLGNGKECIKRMLEIYPESHRDVITGMWHAIDAYVDINE